MEQGEVPPNWEDLYCFSKECATDESFNLALKWISGQEIDVNRGRSSCPNTRMNLKPF